jgi:DNA-binding CsgD family transcriptional regulator
MLAGESTLTAEAALGAYTDAGAPPATIADFLADYSKALKQHAYVESRIWRPFVERGLSYVREDRGRPWAKLMLLSDPVTPISREVIRAGRWIGFDAEAVEVARKTGDEEDFARSFESFDPRTRAETDALVDRARTWIRPTAIMYGLTVAANDYHYRHGEFRDAAALWEELNVLGERFGAINWQAQATNQLTWLHIAAGRFDQARFTEARANALLNRLGPGRRSNVLAMEMATSFALFLGGDWRAIGDFWANFVDDPSLGPSDIATLSGSFFGALAAYAYAEAGDVDCAQRLLAPLVATLKQMSPTDTNQNGAVAWAAAATWRLGQHEYAAVLYRCAVDLIDAGIGDYPQTSNQLTLARMSALLGQRDAALVAFERTRETLEQSGQRPLLGIAMLDHATILSRGGPANYRQVMEHLELASAIFEDLGMSPWTARAESLRVDAETRLGGRTQLPAGLTEREADVLKLVARGFSDRQISDDLFISPRTVNAHLRNMLNKTSVTNRTELSIWAFEHGLVTRE